MSKDALKIYAVEDGSAGKLVAFYTNKDAALAHAGNVPNGSVVVLSGQAL